MYNKISNGNLFFIDHRSGAKTQAPQVSDIQWQVTEIIIELIIIHIYKKFSG